jgi:leucyl aminopeptidase (aminopeptidase T)
MPGESVSEETRQKVARSILTKNLKVRKGERVIVEGWNHTLPWAVALSREARRLGAQPIIVYEDEPSYWDSIDDGEAKVVGAPAAHESAAWTKTDVYIHMWGPGDRVRLGQLPEATQDRLFAWNPGWYETARKAGTRGARLELGRPYPTMAKAYGVDEAEWTNQLVEASLVDPATMARSAAPIAKALQTGKRLRVRHSNGTDVTLGLAGRKPIIQNATVPPAGKRGQFGMLTTIPNGAVRVALDEKVADGTVVANRTSFYDNMGATGGTFHFADGRLTEATFDHGGERFDREFAKGGKGRDQPGWFGIGLNPKLNNTPPDEDLERGAVTISVGGNRGFGGKNTSPFFGWTVIAGATVEVDGKRISP